MGTPVDPLFFLDGETEARGRTRLARSSMEIVGNRPGIQASRLAIWPLGCALSPATPLIG